MMPKIEDVLSEAIGSGEIEGAKVNELAVFALDESSVTRKDNLAHLVRSMGNLISWANEVRDAANRELWRVAE